METARLDVGTRERIVQRRSREAILADLEVDLEVVAMENIVNTVMPKAMTRTSDGNSIRNWLHSGTRT